MRQRLLGRWRILWLCTNCAVMVSWRVSGSAGRDSPTGSNMETSSKGNKSTVYIFLLYISWDILRNNCLRRPGFLTANLCPNPACQDILNQLDRALYLSGLAHDVFWDFFKERYSIIVMLLILNQISHPESQRYPWRAVHRQQKSSWEASGLFGHRPWAVQTGTHKGWLCLKTNGTGQ